jgi:CheY-like chemotaxis protein
VANNLNPRRVSKAKPVKRVLIVDDDPQMRVLLREILSEEGYQILEATDGKQALELIHQQPVDLLITDRAMPVMDGMELLEKLREEKRAIPALVISAYGDEAMWASAIGLGAEDYVLKPFSTESVMRVVKRKLGS